MYAHIVETPGVCGGRPRIEGHRIRVQDIAVAFTQQDMSVEEICEQYPGVTLAEAHSAMAYYFDHKDRIEADLEADERAVKEFQQQQPDSVA